MPYKTGVWGEQAKQRATNRRAYFRKVERIKKDRPDNDSLGLCGENEAMELLGVKHKALLEDGVDIIYKDKKIDVKTATLRTKKGIGWQFTTYPQKNKTDYYFCIAKQKSLVTSFVFLIPEKDITKKYLWISLKNIDKYKKYIFKKGDEIL